MKLLRISSDREDGTFQNQINANLLLKPFSQVALSNASFTNDYPILNIDTSNNVIKFNVSDGATNPNMEKIVNLIGSSYVGTDSDAERLFQDVSLAMNASLTLVGKEFGGEFQLNKLAGRITLQYRITPFLLAQDVSEDQRSGNMDFEGGFVEDDESTTTQKVYANGGANAVGDDSCRAVGILGFSRGSAVFRVTLNKLVQNGNANNGFRMVLTDTDPDTIVGKDLTAEEDKFAINCLPDPADLSLFKYQIREGDGVTRDLVDGTGTIIRPNLPTQDANGFATTSNDTLQLSINAGKVEASIFQTDGTGTQTAILAFSVPYDGAKLYPIAIIRGLSNTTELYNIQSTPRQNFNVNPSVSLGQTTITEIHRNSLNIPQPPGIRSSDFRLDLSGAQDLANFLGLNVGANTGNRFVYLRPAYTRVATFIGASNFSLQSFESYVVQLQSQILESYDGGSFKTGAGNGAKLGEGGQFSILKVIPNYNQNVDNRVCNYEASNLTFIDLNNKEPILLRNINARILNASLDQIKTQNISILTLLFKEQNESV